MIVMLDQPAPYRVWGDNLRTWRLARGYRSQRALADALGVHKNAVQSWESGKRSPRDPHKAAICRLLNVPASNLFPISALEQQ